MERVGEAPIPHGRISERHGGSEELPAVVAALLQPVREHEAQGVISRVGVERPEEALFFHAAPSVAERPASAGGVVKGHCTPGNRERPRSAGAEGSALLATLGAARATLTPACGGKNSMLSDPGRYLGAFEMLSN